MGEPSPPTAFALAAAAERLEKSMADLSTDIGTLRTYGQRNRWLIRALGAIGAVLVVVVVVLGVLVHKTSDNAGKANRATSAAAQALRAQRITCEASNEARALNRSLWGYVLGAAAKNPDAQKAQLDAFRKVIDTTFADRDCTPPAATAK